MAAAWLAVATGVGVLVGRMIRQRDRQVPPAPDPRQDEVPEDRSRQVPGRGQERPT